MKVHARMCEALGLIPPTLPFFLTDYLLWVIVPSGQPGKVASVSVTIVLMLMLRAWGEQITLGMQIRIHLFSVENTGEGGDFYGEI